MYFRQILHRDLGCASYVIADRGEAAIVDPKWEIDIYLRAAREAKAQIRHVLETHNHADHVSGRRRLLTATGARAHVPPAAPGAPAGCGGVIELGGVEIVAVPTPGHRPEHTAYLVCEGGTPRRLLAGDSLLVGDVARPDLAAAAEQGARALWESLQRLLALDDEVQVWPAHVGGSLCASRSASADTSSTIGRERAHNPLLSCADADTFVAQITRCMPARPPRLDSIVELNRSGARHPGPVREFDAEPLSRLLDRRACIIDLRDPDAFDAGHLAGSVNLPASARGLGTRAGWAAGEDPIVLVAPTVGQAHAAAELLRAAGVWKLAGLTVADPEAWRAAGLSVREGVAMSADALTAALQDRQITLVDVRDPEEWEALHVAGSRSLPLAKLGDGSRVADLSAPVAVVCASGLRAAVAASILRRRDCEPAWRVRGGVEDLAHCGAAMARGLS